MKRVLDASLRPEWIFVVLALVFGTAFASITPPGYNPDEPHQFFRAIQAADGVLYAEAITEDEFSKLVDRPAEGYGGAIPVEYAELFDLAQTFPIVGPGYPGAERSSQIDWEAIWQLRPGDEKIEIGFSNTAVYSPLAYAPVLVSIVVGEFVHAPVAAIFYGARFLSLLTAIALTFLAIRIIPVGKWALLAIALLPTTVIEFAAVSADPMTIASSFVLIAYSLRLGMSERAPTIREWALLCGALVLMGLVKPSYAVLFGVAFAIPVLNRAARARRPLISLASVLAIAAVPTVLWQRTTSYLPPSFSTVEKVSTQIEFAVSHPFVFAKTLALTFFTDEGPGRFFYPSFFGSGIWNGIFLPTVFIYASAIALVVAAFIVDKREERHGALVRSRENGVVKVGFLAVFVISCTVLALGLYAIWSEPQLTAVTGLQGRYFIPLALLVSYAFVGVRLVPQGWAKLGTVLVSTGSLAVMLISVWLFVYSGHVGTFWQIDQP